MAERRPVTIRITDTALEYVAKQAKDHRVTQAIVLRAMFAVATQHPDEVATKIKAMGE